MKNYADHLYLLSFIDISDRIDILLLEIRHLQNSIIYSLHAPTLFLPLRHEEKLIFDGWKKELEKNDHDFKTAKLTSEHIIRYPAPRRAIQHLAKQNNEEKQNPIKAALLTKVGEIWSGDLWTRGERRHYHALRSLQILKQQVFRNKLMFYREARQTGLLDDISQSSSHKRRLKKPALMILRRAVIHRLNKFIRILRTHQQQFGKSLDFGLQSYPRPSIERRREIGIFNDFLSNRTRDLQYDMRHLLHTVLQNNNKKDDTENYVSPLVLHGWSQSPKVSNTQLYDNVSLNVRNAHEKTRVQHVSYIDTSFWSPDRPDLQPLVAKEIAQSVIRNDMKDLSDNYLSNNVNDFTTLIVILYREINEFTKDVKALEPVRENVHLLIREIAYDLLAVSIKGISYLYAIFLAIVGDGLEEQLRINNILRVEAIYDLSQAVAPFEEQFMWFIRLQLCSYWIQKVMHVPLSSLDKIVVSGVTEVCDQLVDYLDSSVPATHTAVGVLWKQLVARLEIKIDQSYMITTVRQWREKRSQDTWNEHKNKKEVSGHSGEKNYHRSTMRLDVRLQNYLYRQILHQKSCQKYKPLFGYPDSDLGARFKEVYGLESEKINVPYTDDSLNYPRWLFRHLYDIPFQCAVMRSIDILGNTNKGGGQNYQPEKLTWGEFIEQAHQDMSMGRELFAFSLEFYTWGRESPRNRLVLCNNLIMFILPDLSKSVDRDVLKPLIDWQRGAPAFSDNSAPKIAKKYADYSHNKLRQAFTSANPNEEVSPLLEKLGAIHINAAFSFIRESTASQERRLEQLAGYKLKELLTIYERLEKKENLGKKLSILKSLGAFLRIRNSNHNETSHEAGRSSPLARERFFTLLLPTFGDKEKEKEEKPPLIKPVMISRIAMTNYYAVAKVPFDNKEDYPGKEVDNENINGLTLYESLTNKAWMNNSVIEERNNKKKKGNGSSILLGQYDAINIKPTRLPCHCKIPEFEEYEKQEEERFSTHFVRRELALPVTIYSSSDVTKDTNKQLLAIISISLQRRSMRLNLIYRLLDGVAFEGEENELAELESSIYKLRNNHANNIDIKGYLTDGWGDLLLMIEVDKTKIHSEETGDLIDDIFNLQQSLYEDFMVDRTELTYTPVCLDHFASSKEYDFSFAVRLMEDRKLEESMKMYRNAFDEKKKQNKHDLLNKEQTSMVRTPGQMDYILRFALKEKKLPQNIYNALLEWIADKPKDDDSTSVVGKWYSDGMSMLDKIEVLIEKK